MNADRRILQVGSAMILLALILRLAGSFSLEPVAQMLRSPKVGQAMIFLTTGRLVRQQELQSQHQTQASEPPPPAPTQPEQKPISFSGEDGALVGVKNTTGQTFDLQALIDQPLTWDLYGDAPTVLILHTHGSESYENTENYPESSLYRTLDCRYNMVSVGERVAQRLEAAGIGAIHDKTLHDNPSYSGSYEQSRKSMASYLEQYPSICLVLDLHRDAAEDGNGNQVSYTVQTPEGAAAKLMLVLGTNDGGLYHPNWRENLALGVKLQVCLEKSVPGICRNLCLRTSRFNQDLSPGALLIEVGSAGNTRQEALLAADLLAEAIITLAKGAN